MNETFLRGEKNVFMMKWLFLLGILLLSPGSTVVFIIRDSAGNPVEGAEIYFCARKAVTDAEGTATFENIPDLSSTPYSGCTLEIRKEGYLPVIDAFAVTEDVVLSYVLYSDIMATISGIVYFDTSDNPQPFAAVRIFDAATGEPLGSILTDDEGRFSLELSMDRSVYAYVSDYEDQKFYLSAEKEQILVVTTKGIVSDVEVSVRDSKRRPLEDVVVVLESGSVTYDGRTDAQGTALIESVRSGEYVITLEKEGFSTVTSEVAVAPPERGGVYSLDMILERATGTVVVTVSSGGKALSATVVITADEKEIARIRVEGTESITLETGTYTLEVSASGYESVKRQVLLLEDQTKQVDLDLEKTQRRVKVTSEGIPSEVLLLILGGILIFILLLSLHVRKR